MTDRVDIAETTLTHRVVLAGLASLDESDGTPAHAGEVRRVCTADLDAVDADVVGTLDEAEVSRALNELEAEGLVTASTDDTSATGKGRPRYTLAVETDALVATLADDGRLDAVLEHGAV